MLKAARWSRLLVRCTPARLSVFLCVATCAAWVAVTQAGGMNRFHDAQFLSAYERHARMAVTLFHQLPLWDPYNCGGLYGLAAPQTRYASPFFLLSLLFGVDRAASLIAVLLPAIGMEGMYRYARAWGALGRAAFLLAPLYPLCGWFALSWRFGWIQFYSFCLVPWILLGLRGALRGQPRGALLCALAVAVTVGFGGTYTLPMALLLCLGELVDAASPRLRMLRRAPGRYWVAVRRRLSRLRRGLLFATPLVVGISAYRLWPMLESVPATLRIMGGEPRMALSQLGGRLFSMASASSHGAGHFYLAPVLALAFFASPLRGTLGLWLGACLSFALALGHAFPHAPFVLLRTLPIYDTLRYPERYLLLFALAGAVLAARGAGLLLARARGMGGRRALRALSAVLLLAALGAVGLQARNTYVLASRVQLVPVPAVQDAPFGQSRGNRWLMSHFAAEGMGSLGCGEAYPLPMSRRLRGDLPAEEYLAPLAGDGAAQGRARRMSWSPNRLVVAVDTPRAVRLAINQNYHPGWRSSVGRVESWEGLLSVVLPAGEHQVTLRFWPRSGIGGSIASLVALACGILWAFRPKKGETRVRGPWRRAVEVLLVSAGPLTVALFMLVWPEPTWQRPAPRTETGEPVVLASLPEHARPLRVRFEVPLVLEGSLVPAAPVAAGGREVMLRLFFRRTGPLSPSLGIFVHLLGPDGLRVHADHPELSGQVYLPRMPLGEVVQDVFWVALPPRVQGEWEVRVGLWNAYGDGARLPIVDRGAAQLVDDAAVAGRFRIR